MHLAVRPPGPSSRGPPAVPPAEGQSDAQQPVPIDFTIRYHNGQTIFSSAWVLADTQLPKDALANVSAKRRPQGSSDQGSLAPSPPPVVPDLTFRPESVEFRGQLLDPGFHQAAFPQNTAHHLVPQAPVNARLYNAFCVQTKLQTLQATHSEDLPQYVGPATPLPAADLGASGNEHESSRPLNTAPTATADSATSGNDDESSQLMGIDPIFTAYSDTSDTSGFSYPLGIEAPYSAFINYEMDRLGMSNANLGMLGNSSLSKISDDDYKELMAVADSIN